jgi:hypothetical protein
MPRKTVDGAYREEKLLSYTHSNCQIVAGPVRGCILAAGIVTQNCVESIQKFAYYEIRPSLPCNSRFEVTAYLIRELLL